MFFFVQLITHHTPCQEQASFHKLIQEMLSRIALALFFKVLFNQYYLIHPNHILVIYLHHILVVPHKQTMMVISFSTLKLLKLSVSISFKVKQVILHNCLHCNISFLIQSPKAAHFVSPKSQVLVIAPPMLLILLITNY